MKKETKALISALDQVILTRQTDVFDIEKEEQGVKEIIEDFRKRVKKYFDDLEKKSLDELHLKEKTIKDGIYQEKRYLESAKSKAEDFLKQLESFQGENECDFFVKLKTGKQFVEMAMRKIKSISKIQQKPSVHFEINTDIESYLSSLNSLGVFLDAPEDSLLSRPIKAKVSEIQSSQNANNIELFGRFCVADESDSKVCDISSISLLSDGEVIVADSTNSKLKKLDKTYKLVDSVNMPASVHSVCLDNVSQVAASLYMKRTIQHVSVEPELGLITSFSVGAYCRGMCCLGDKLLVCSGDVFQPNSGHIEVYDSAGRQQDTIPIAPRRLTAVPLYITGSDDGEYLLVTSYKCDNITVLDLTGNVVTTFSHKHLIGPRGLCTDSRGHVFVCGSGSNTVVQLSLEHQEIDVLLTEKEGIKEPEGICFDRKTSRLLIGLSNSNDMYVYILK